MRTRRFLVLLVAVASALASSGCSSSDVTQKEFVDHAMKISTSAKTPQEKGMLSLVFACTWKQIKDDSALLDSFMGSDRPDAELSAAFSKKMVPCLPNNISEQQRSASETSTTTP